MPKTDAEKLPARYDRDVTAAQVSQIDDLLSQELSGPGWVTIESEEAEAARELVKEIAMDIGKEVVAYVKVMYPQAIEHTSSTFPLSLRNSIYNEIMAAIQVTDEGKIKARLRDRKAFRRRWVAAWKRNRGE